MKKIFILSMLLISSLISFSQVTMITNQPAYLDGEFIGAVPTGSVATSIVVTTGSSYINGFGYNINIQQSNDKGAWADYGNKIALGSGSNSTTITITSNKAYYKIQYVSNGSRGGFINAIMNTNTDYGNLPAQSGNDNLFLKTNGTNASWSNSFVAPTISSPTVTGTAVFSGPGLQKFTATTYTASGTYTITATQLSGGLLVAATTTATTTMVLPSTSSLSSLLGAGQGDSFDFEVINNGATNGTVTVQVGTGMTSSGFPGTNTLTLAGSATVGIMRLRIKFISTSISTLARKD